jgi:hypothetical protein
MKHLNIYIFLTLLLVANLSTTYSKDGIVELNSHKIYLLEVAINPLIIRNENDLNEQKIREDQPTSDSTKKSTSSVFAILNSSGRTLLETDVTDPNCGNQKGNSYIVVKVLISPSGDVLNALAGINDGNTKTKNASQCLIDWAKSAALTLKFSETKSEQNQSGIIIFDIREK